MIALRGLSAFPITPMDPDGRVEVAAYRRLIARLREAEVDSIGALGSTGSYPYLTRAERRRALETALEEAGGIPVLAGVGALRTDEAVALAEDARAAGAAAGLLAPVSYTPLGDDEVFEHFSAVAKTGLPLCIYDNPGTTHFRFSPALIGRLSRVAGIAAVKSPAPEAGAVAAHLADLRAQVREGFSLGYSVDWHCVEAMLAGGGAWYSVLAGLFPKVAMAITRTIEAGDAAAARRLNSHLQPLWDLFKAHSSLRVVYTAANVLDLCQAAPPRPILPLAGEIRERIARVISELGLA